MRLCKNDMANGDIGGEKRGRRGSVVLACHSRLVGVRGRRSCRSPRALRMPPRQRPGKSPTRTRPTAPAPDLPIAVELDGGAVAHRWRLANGALVAAAADTAAPAAPARHTISLAARASAEICSIFLPSGYPESVRPEYLRFQVYDTLQAACSYLRNILTTSAILRGAGVGADAASPMAAAIAWVLRDGVGMFGSLVFSYAIGGGFDRNVKVRGTPKHGGRGPRGPRARLTYDECFIVSKQRPNPSLHPAPRPQAGVPAACSPITTHHAPLTSHHFAY